VNISPLDVRKHEFKKTLRGYDVDEVLAFLDMVSIEMENLVRENSSLKERGASVDSQLKKYHDIENTLRETLLSAQKAREETINTAKKHADVIIREAEVKAAAIVDEGRSDLSRVRGTLAELKMQKETYLVKIRSMINTQLEIIDTVDFPEDKNISIGMDQATSKPASTYIDEAAQESELKPAPMPQNVDNNPLEGQI